MRARQQPLSTSLAHGRGACVRGARDAVGCTREAVRLIARGMSAAVRPVAVMFRLDPHGREACVCGARDAVGCSRGSAADCEGHVRGGSPSCRHVPFGPAWEGSLRVRRLLACAALVCMCQTWACVSWASCMARRLPRARAGAGLRVAAATGRAIFCARNRVAAPDWRGVSVGVRVSRESWVGCRMGRLG